MNIFELFGRIAVDNKDALSQINKTSKAAASISKAFSQAEGATGKSLKQIAAENGKTVNQVRSEVAKVAAEYRKQGMSASDAMKKAYADIGYYADKAHDKVNEEAEETGNKYSKLASKVGSAFKSIGSFAVKCGTVVGTGLAAGATAMTGLVVKSMNLAGELEQNMGGADAVFGAFADNMKKKAAEAYSVMGLSQSEYLATANKMGSLFKGSGFEVAEAASLTTDAMQRAADVASIMGIDVSTAMESIAGAAKGNFTMMDNLGVAVNDTAIANYALEKGIKKSTAQMSTQEKVALAMELFMEKTAYAAGNYAKENETLAGSLTTAKAALKNFLSGAGDAKSVATALTSTGKVITKNLKNLLPHLVEGINELIVSLTPELPGLIEASLPGIIEGAGTLLTGLAKALPSLAKVVAEKVPEILRNLTSEVAKALPELGYGVKQAWSKGVWPLIRDAFKIAFDIDLPEKWEKVWMNIRVAWDKSGIGDFLTNTVASTFNTVKDAISWCIDNKEKAVLAFGVLGTAIATMAATAHPILAIAAALTAIASINDDKYTMENISPHQSDAKQQMDAIGQEYGVNMLSDFDNPNRGIFQNMDSNGAILPFTSEAALRDKLSSDIRQAYADNNLTGFEAAASGVQAFVNGWNEGLRGADLQSAVDEATKNLESKIPTVLGVEAATQEAQRYLKEQLLQVPIEYVPHNMLGQSMYMGKGNKQPVIGAGDLANYVPGHASGLNFVPYDNYLARLHYGETVLTRKDADAWRKGSTGNMAMLSAKFDQMQETFIQVLEGIRNQPIAVNIDSKTAAVLMAKEMTKSIGNRNIQALMGMGG